MNIREIELLNHYLEDDKSQNRDNSMGDFRLSLFGYYDGARIGEAREELQQTQWESMCKKVIKNLDGTYTSRSIGCLYEDQNKTKEMEFWKQKTEYPFYFFIMMRVEKVSKIRDNIAAQNDRDNIMVYFSYEHSEIIAVCRASMYREGIQKIHELKAVFDAQKTYSIFAVEEEFLQSKNFWEDRPSELVELRLNATMRDRKCATKFFYKLGEKLKEGNSLIDLEVYDEIGEEDVLVEIHNIDLNQILPLYAMGEMLTHSNTEYNKAVYNIKTRIIVRED